MTVAPKEKVQVWIYQGAPKGEIQVLLLRMRPDRGGYWQPVTGSVEAGELPSEAALREAQEETGLAFKKFPRALGYEFSFEKGGVAFHETAFGLEAASHEVQVDPEEHVECSWVSPQDALCLIHYPSNADGLRALLKKMRE